MTPAPRAVDLIIGRLVGVLLDGISLVICETFYSSLHIKNGFYLPDIVFGSVISWDMWHRGLRMHADPR
jgi:hypothetical protein